MHISKLTTCDACDDFVDSDMQNTTFTFNVQLNNVSLLQIKLILAAVLLIMLALIISKFFSSIQSSMVKRAQTATILDLMYIVWLT